MKKMDQLETTMTKVEAKTEQLREILREGSIEYFFNPYIQHYPYDLITKVIGALDPSVQPNLGLVDAFEEFEMNGLRSTAEKDRCGQEGSMADRSGLVVPILQVVGHSFHVTISEPRLGFTRKLRLFTRIQFSLIPA